MKIERISQQDDLEVDLYHILTEFTPHTWELLGASNGTMRLISLKQTMDIQAIGP